MKILPKKQDLIKLQNAERKMEVDSGVILATQIDKLRETKNKEEKELIVFRDTAKKQVQYEIDQLLEEKSNLEKQNNEARKQRDRLLKPLDKEWQEVNLVKSELEKEKDRIYLSGEQLKVEEEKGVKAWKKVTKIYEEINLERKETQKQKDETGRLKRLAESEYQNAKEEHISQTNIHEQRLKEVAERLREYEVALITIQIRENAVKEKEEDLIIREKELTRQQTLLRITSDILNKNATVNNAG